jgi:hypothetical protein
MANTGEHVLYGGQNIFTLFRVLAIALIGFAWIYLPIHANSSFDFIACLFAAELLGIVIVFTYYFTTGVGLYVYQCYESV